MIDIEKPLIAPVIKEGQRISDHNAKMRKKRMTNNKDKRIKDLEQKLEWKTSQVNDLRHQLDVAKYKLQVAGSEPRRCKECPLGDGN